jgi:hypothetical protein
MDSVNRDGLDARPMSDVKACFHIKESVGLVMKTCPRCAQC